MVVGIRNSQLMRREDLLQSRRRSGRVSESKTTFGATIADG